MLVLRLQRTGKRNDPTFRIVAAEKRRAVKGKCLEIIGHYLPTRNPVVFKCDQERVSHWISNGAQPSNTLARLLTKDGMTGLEKFIDTYTKKKKRKEVEVSDAVRGPEGPSGPEREPAAAPASGSKPEISAEPPTKEENSQPEVSSDDTDENEPVEETPPAEEEKPQGEAMDEESDAEASTEDSAPEAEEEKKEE